MKPPARPGLWLVATREDPLFPARSRRAVSAYCDSADRLCGSRLDVQQRSRARAQCRRRRHGPLGGLDWLIQAIAAAPGLRVTQRGDSSDDRHQGDPLRRGDRCGLYPAEFRARPAGRTAGRRSLRFYNTQYFTPGNIASKGLRDAISAAAAPALAVARCPAAAGRQRPAGRRAIRPDQPGGQLCGVSAARRDADDAARRHRDCDRLRGRNGVLAPQPARLAALCRRQPARRPRRQAAAAVRRVLHADGGRRADPACRVRAALPRQHLDDDGRRGAVHRRLPVAGGLAAAAGPQSCRWA